MPDVNVRAFDGMRRDVPAAQLDPQEGRLPLYDRINVDLTQWPVLRIRPGFKRITGWGGTLKVLAK